MDSPDPHWNPDPPGTLSQTPTLTQTLTLSLPLTLSRFGDAQSVRRLGINRIKRFGFGFDPASCSYPPRVATPEETHTGRQAHHSRREVFLTNNTDENCVDSLLRKAAVLLPQQYRDATRLANEAAATARRKAREAKAAKDRGEEPATGVVEPDDKESNKDPALAAAEAAGDDVFLCEYTYDQHFHRFKRRTEWDDDDLSDDDLTKNAGTRKNGTTCVEYHGEQFRDTPTENSRAEYLCPRWSPLRHRK